MQLAKKSLAVFLSFVLSFSLMGVPAYADDVSSSSGNQTANASGVTQTLEGFGTSEHTSAAQNILPSEYAKQNLVDTIAYVYLDNALIAAGQTQYIAVGFTDEQFVAQNATLTLLRESTNEQRVLTSTSQTAGAVLFAFETTEADIDAYKIQTLTWGNSQNGYFGLSFDEDESLTNTYAFDVVSDELVSTLQEAAAIAQDTNTAVLTIDKKGKFNACASVEQALALSDSDGMEQGSVSASSGTLANDDASQSANMQSGQASSQKGFFQTIFDAIIAFFRDLFVPKDAYAEVSSAREDYLIVAVDPGHGGTDPGAIGNGLAEDNVNYSIATHLVDELSTYSGVSTVLTRSESEYVGLQERVNRAVASGADVIVSIHCNASGTGNAYGSEVWVPNDSSYYYEETHVVGEELGSQILTQLSALGLYNRGVKTLDSTDGDTYPDGSLADYYTVINAARKAGIPGIIVEHAFIDSEDDAYNYLTTDEQRTTLGVADATGIATQYGLVKDTTAQAQASVKVQAYVATLGWESAVYDGKVAGSVGKSFSVEALTLSLQNDAASAGGIEYRSASDDGDWQSWQSSGATTGSTEDDSALNRIQIKLTGSAATSYDVYYRTHVSNVGWLGWAKNGQSAGSSGYGYAIEAIEVVLVTKGSAAPGSTDTPYIGQGASVSLSYRAHVENIGWQDYVESPEMAGTSGQALRVEALQAQIESPYAGDIEISTHVQNIGWQEYVGSGEIAGTSGQALRLEAIKVQLTDALAENFDVYYRVHAQTYGWLDWASNGQKAGTAGFGLRLEAIEIALVEKGGSAPGATDQPYIDKLSLTTLKYAAHVENIGWQDYVTSPEMAGTSGQSLRVEALKAQIESTYSGDIQISTHVQNIGWQDYVGSGEIAGTSGQALRLEAMKVQLTDELAEQYDVYYRVHAQNYGWLDWAKNGQKAGTSGYGLRLEAIEIALVEKDGSAPGATDQPYIDILSTTTLKYSAHVENIGWQDYVESPEMAGTSGQSLRVEALKAQIESPYEGDIEISTHVENIGWQEYVGSGELAGTSGLSYRLEAMKVQLTDELAENFDVYYRVHAQNIGWMGWAKNGEEAGTSGYGFRLEAIQIALVEKGGSAPESTVGHFVGTSIMGSTNTSVEQMVACYESQGASYPSSVYSQCGAATITDFCQILYEEATTEGVNAEIVFAQAMTETGWLQFGGDVKAEQCNFAGLGATGNGNPGEDFSDYGTDAVRIGLRAQVQHLKAYASTDELVQTCVDNRFAYVSRGCAPTLDGLTGTWAADSSYANKLKALVLELFVTSA